MHIIVCVKQVPDPETPPSAFKIDEAARRVIPAPGIAPVASQFDSIAMEAALRVRDQTADTTITVLTLGPDSAREIIKMELARGADEAVLINDPALLELDSFGTARVLAAAIGKLSPFDLVLCGRQAVDWDMGVVPAGLAETLGVPLISITKDVQVSDGRIRVVRVLPDGTETVEATLPAVVSVSNELGEPRYPQLRQIMLAARKQVILWSGADIGIDGATAEGLRVIELERLYQPTFKTEAEIIEADTPEEAGAQLADRLREARLI